MIQLDLEEFNLFKHIFVFENFSAQVRDFADKQRSEFLINPLLYQKVTSIEVVMQNNQETIVQDKFYQIQFEGNQYSKEEINQKIKEFLKQANKMIGSSIDKNFKKIEGIIYQDFQHFSLCFS